MFDFAGDLQPLTVGSFEGSVVESSSETIGVLSDGTTGIQFETDLPVDEVAIPPGVAAAVRPEVPGPSRWPPPRRNDPKVPVRRPTALLACGHQRKEVVQRMNDGSHGTLEVAGR